MVDVDSETLFNAAAAVVATIAVGVFVLNVSFGYSPVTTVALVVAFLAGVFAITQRTDDRQLTLLGYGVLVVSSVILFFDLMETFQVDDTLTALGLLGIAAVLFSLRSLLGADNRFVDGRTATVALGVLVALAVVVLVVDVATGGLAYELQTQDRVEFTDPDRNGAVVGQVVAVNPTPLPEQVDVPRYRACTAGDWSAYRRPGEPGEEPNEVRADLHVQDGYNEHVFGFGSRAFPLVLHVGGASLRGESFPVQVTETCPEGDSGPAYLAVFAVPERRGYGYPA